MLKKVEKEVEKEFSSIKKAEEKVLFRLFGFKIKKKLIFSIILGLFVFIMGTNKIDALHSLGKHISWPVLLITFLFCSLFLFLTVIRKKPSYYLKQALLVFLVISLVLGLLITFGFTLSDILFLSLITTAVSLAIFDIF